MDFIKSEILQKIKNILYIFRWAKQMRRKCPSESMLNNHLRRITSGKLVMRKGIKKLYHLCTATSVTTKKYPLNDEIKRENPVYSSFFAIRYSSHSLIPQTKKDLATRSGTKVVDVFSQRRSSIKHWMLRSFKAYPLLRLSSTADPMSCSYGLLGMHAHKTKWKCRRISIRISGLAWDSI